MYGVVYDAVPTDEIEEMDDVVTVLVVTPYPVITESTYVTLLNDHDKEFNVNTDDYTFNLFLTKEEADNLYKQKIGSFITIRYSVKRYVEERFLETLVDSKLVVQGTVKWNGDTGGGEQNG